MEETPNIVEAVSLGGGTHDMSVWSLFLEAGFVVQMVMVLLIIASFWSWVIIFDKIMRLRNLNMETTKFENTFWSGTSLETLYDKLSKNPPEPMASIFVSAMAEWKRANLKGLTGKTKEALMQRIERAMDIAIAKEMEKTEKYLIFLASVGATAPYIGLFGTVWGILHSFQAIALTQNTTLSSVAPGIAEALFATALGLVAAIPAVLAYNKISTDLGRYAARLESFAGEFSAIISRQLDEKDADSNKKAA